jgi:hypothetical protein
MRRPYTPPPITLCALLALLLGSASERPSAISFARVNTRSVVGGQAPRMPPYFPQPRPLPTRQSHALDAPQHPATPLKPGHTGPKKTQTVETRSQDG